jgi:hypothetical protein
MAFNISFLETVKRPSKTRPGQIILNDFSERFESPLDFWTASDYERQWVLAVARLAGGESKSALITAMHPPDSANFLMWWLMFRDGNRVVFRNHMLLMERLETPFDLAKLYSFIPDRTPGRDEEYPISEWSVDLEGVQSFLH